MSNLGNPGYTPKQPKSGYGPIWPNPVKITVKMGIYGPDWPYWPGKGPDGPPPNGVYPGGLYRWQLVDVAKGKLTIFAHIGYLTTIWVVLTMITGVWVTK